MIEENSQIILGDSFPIVDLKAFNTDGKDAQFIQRNQVIEKMVEKEDHGRRNQKGRVQVYDRHENTYRQICNGQ